MSEHIVVEYAGCLNQAMHNLIDPSPEIVDGLVARGVEYRGDGYFRSPDLCPRCEQERRDYVASQLAAAGIAVTDENIVRWEWDEHELQTDPDRSPKARPIS